MEFTKMEAAGNDFVLFNGFKYRLEDLAGLAKKACDRHFSVGGDGIMVARESEIADIRMIYYNSDGSQGEMCGNGIRCFSKYVYDKDLVKTEKFTVETLAGVKTIGLEVDVNNQVEYITVDMGEAILDPSLIPLVSDQDQVLEESLSLGQDEIVFSAALVGVPHVVIFQDKIDQLQVNKLGRQIENHPLFPKKTNVNFVKILARDKIEIYTWERGAGRTLGCGTGASASVFIGHKLGKLDEKVQVLAEGGEMEIHIQDKAITMKGGANTICHGNFLNI